MGFAVFAGGRAIVAHVAMHLAGGEIMVRPAQVVPEVVGHVNPQGVAAQADQGQEKLEDQDGCPHRGTDHKDDGHRYLLAEEFRNPQVFRSPKGNIGRPIPIPAKTPTHALRSSEFLYYDPVAVHCKYGTLKGGGEMACRESRCPCELAADANILPFPLVDYSSNSNR